MSQGPHFANSYSVVGETQQRLTWITCLTDWSTNMVTRLIIPLPMSDVQQTSDRERCYSVQEGQFVVDRIKLGSVIRALWASIYKCHYFCCYHLVSLLEMGPQLCWVRSLQRLEYTSCLGSYHFIFCSLHSEAHHTRVPRCQVKPESLVRSTFLPSEPPFRSSGASMIRGCGGEHQGLLSPLEKSHH